MKYGFSIFLAACLLSLNAIPADAKKKVRKAEVGFSQCEGSLEHAISTTNREACAFLADKGKLTRRQRAIVYFHLGVLEAFEPFDRTNSIRESTAVEGTWYDKAIAADPTFEWPYLYAAELWQGNENGKAIAYAEHGLAKNPNSSFLRAVLAQMKISSGQQDQSIALCRNVMQDRPLDYVTATICGETFTITKKWEESFTAFAEAEKTYKPNKPNSFGLKERTNPSSGMAFSLSMRDRNQEAIDLLTKYLARKDVGFDTRLIRRDRAAYHEKLGKFAEAAADLDAYSKGADLQSVTEVRVKQMVMLARAGKPKEAQTIADVVYGPAPLKFVLRLQVKLRNAHFDDLEFTGKYDAQTKTALERCLSEPTCFGDVVGQRV
jgi:tetratricopeptide (TPR) repeat protein